MNVSASADGPAPNAALPRWQRWLLPAVLGVEYADRDPGGGVDLPRSPRDWAVDLVLFGFAVLVGLGALVSDRRDVGTAMLAVDAVLGVPACLALWVRRRYPLAVGFLVVGAATVSGAASGAAIVAMLTVAVRCRPRRPLQLAAVWIVSAGVYADIYRRQDYNAGGLAFAIIVMIAVLGFGAFVRVRRELLLSLQERARRAEDEQLLRVREAQLAERARIAREMHDVLAHRISLLSVHAGALEFNPDASPQEIARAASVIRVSARAAQEELREVVGVLRAGLGPEDVQPPQPTIADLARLVEESRDAGMSVSLSNALEGEPLSPILGRTVYRLVQEGLTNARKHASGQLVTITVDGDRAAGVRVEVVNAPRVGQAVAAAGVPDAASAAAHSGGGHVGSGTGIVGLAERVTLVGGQLATDVPPGGGFRLSATLPWSDLEAGQDQVA